MHKVIIVGKVKTAILNYTQNGKAVFNVKLWDGGQDKNEVWHGANFEMAFWEDAAENAAKHIEAGKVYVFEGSIDKVKTFDLKSGGVGTAIVLQFPQYRFIPGTGEVSATDVDGAVVTETESVGFGD